MTNLQSLVGYAALSGSTIFLGGLLSYYFGAHVKSGKIKAEIVHSSIAFGGGILMAAIGLVFIPEGMKALSLIPIIFFFIAGSSIFFFTDRYIERRGSTMAQLLGMLLDFLPESIAMGAVFSANHALGILLALIIGVQNLPEAFNVYRDLKVSYSARKCLIILFLLSFSGIAFALLGYYFLSDAPKVVGALMLFSAGGVVYLVFQDIAPMSSMKKNWIPALGACLGFLVGMVSVKLLA